MKKWREIVFLPSILGLLALVVLMEQNVRPPSPAKETPTEPVVLLPHSNAPQTPVSPSLNPVIQGPEGLPVRFVSEWMSAQQIDPDPAASERRLDLLAKSLSSEEILRLRRLTVNDQGDGDARALSVELLARGEGSEVVDALVVIAQSPIFPQGDPRLDAFERSLRMRAIEGLGVLGATRELEQTAETAVDSVLLDRTRRAQAAQGNGVSTPERQDQSALRRLLGGS